MMTEIRRSLFPTVPLSAGRSAQLNLATTWRFPMISFLLTFLALAGLDLSMSTTSAATPSQCLFYSGDAYALCEFYCVEGACRGTGTRLAGPAECERAEQKFFELTGVAPPCAATCPCWTATRLDDLFAKTTAQASCLVERYTLEGTEVTGFSQLQDPPSYSDGIMARVSVAASGDGLCYIRDLESRALLQRPSQLTREEVAICRKALVDHATDPEGECPRRD